jgi:hypothetical protein
MLKSPDASRGNALSSAIAQEHLSSPEGQCNAHKGARPIFAVAHRVKRPA